MKYRYFLLTTLLGLLTNIANAHLPAGYRKNAKIKTAQSRSICASSTSQIDQEINNVRARLLGGGDMWWDLTKGSYIVPKVDVLSGEKEVSAIFAAGVWMGGVDGGGNLKLACQDYRPADRTDFWPGPLNQQPGATDQQTCLDWDKHFRVTGDEIRLHLRQLDEGTADPNNIPAGVKGWPARGNPFFAEVHQFSLPNTGLASFFDADGDANYNPLNGDFPTIEVYGCPPDRYPDEMIFWIYNDEGAGAEHTRTGGKSMHMEVQVQAFGYKTDDELNDMTFQRYKLINRGTDVLDSTFFAIWVDTDLGCPSDDYVGCDTANGLMYAYNQDAVDGQPGVSCDTGVATYGNEVPMIGVDFFRGARNVATFYDWFTGEQRDTLLELGMTHFMYYNGGFSSFPPMLDPSTPPEFYNYLTGSWRDGTRLTKGGSGYNIGSTDFTNFALPSSPDDPNGWSMCSSGLEFSDRRTIQSSGPFRLNPGAVNELIIGVPFVSDVPYPCPDIEYLLRVDRKAQALFEECFGPMIGPDAPHVDWVELNHEVVAVLFNEVAVRNNYQEKYEVRDFFAPDSIKRSQDAGVRRTANYRFEGYKIYQLVNPGVAQTDFDNPDSARLVYQVDKKNGIGKIFNWESTADPNQPNDPTKKIYYPVEKVDGADEGIRHTFSMKEDLFAEGNVRTLINHKKYYYTVVAYAHNNFGDFEQQGVHLAGQQRPYLEGKRIQTYTVIPRPIVDQALNSSYGDSPEITRIEGAGAGGNFLEINKEQRDAMLSPGFNGEVTYNAGKGPINIIIYNPFEVVDGDFEIAFYDSNNNDDVLDNKAQWVLRVKDVDGVYQDINQPYVSIDELNEQLFTYFNFSVTIAQTPETGNLTRSKMDISVPSPGLSNGAIGAKTDFGNRDTWFFGIADQESGPFNFVQTGKAEKYNAADPEQKLSSMGDGSFVPYPLVTGILPSGAGISGRLITPGWTGILNGSAYNDAAMGLLNFNDGVNFDLLNKLPNVDIVFTPDKSQWSRCVVLETASEYFTGNLPGVVKDPALKTESGPGYSRESFDTRFGFAVGKDDNNGDGLPDPDGAVEPDSIPNPSSTDPQKMMENPLKGQPMRGMGWFPGYAVNVETGERLNIFFGENSCYNTSVNQSFTSGDMLWNPTSQGIRPDAGNGEITDFLLGGHHWVYVSNTPYDACNFIRSRLNPDYWTLASLKKVRKAAAIQNIAWAGMLMLQPGQQMNTLNNGLVPSETVVSLRVQNPYQVKVNTGNGHPRYRFQLAGKSAQPLNVAQVQHALDSVKVVPNPYYAASAYQISEGSQMVKITNLPPNAR